MSDEDTGVIAGQSIGDAMNRLGWLDPVAVAEKDATITTLRADLERIKTAAIQRGRDIEQVLGKALGYPWYKDDQKNFPGATEAEGVCVGEHVDLTLADEAASRIAQMRAELATAQATITDLEWERDDYLRKLKAANSTLVERAIEARSAFQQCGPCPSPVLCPDRCLAAQPPAAAALERREADVEDLLKAQRGFAKLAKHHREDHHSPGDMPSDDVVMACFLALGRIVTQARRQRGDSFAEILCDAAALDAPKEPE